MIYLIKRLKGYQKVSETEQVSIYENIGHTSQLSVLHRIAVLNKKWKDNGFAGIPFITEELPLISKRKLQEARAELNKYETC